MTATKRRMETTIIGFHSDEAGDWVAELGCGHGQHMRHKPPWEERAWVTTEEGRRKRTGTPIECPLCDAIALPPDAREYKRTTTFTEQTLPAGLRKEHHTKAGTWARIVVSEGQLEFHSRGRMRVLGAGDAGIVEPEIVHHVTPLGSVRLHVEFWKAG
jgi:tellurite methyltransferase